MDSNAMVNDRLDGGRRLIEELLEKGMPISAAFWARLDQEQTWFLYLVSPMVDLESSTAAYRFTTPVVRSHPEYGIAFDEIRVLGPSDSMGKAAIEDYAARPRQYRGVTPFTGLSLGGVGLDGAYIYSLPAFAV